MDSNDPQIPPPYADVPPTQPPYQAVPPTSAAAAGGLSENLAGALAYVTIIPAIIFLVMEPYNRSGFIRFHSIQSIALFVAWVIWFFAHLLIIWIPILGFLISIVVAVLFFVVWLITLLKASQGQWFKLPFLGDFAMAQAKV